MIRALALAALMLVAAPAAAQTITATPAVPADIAAQLQDAQQKADQARDTAAQAAVAAQAAQQAIPDVSGLARKDEVAAVQTAVMAAMPQRATTPPPTEAIAPTIGTSLRYRGADDPTPRMSRTVSGTTTAAGTGAVTWAVMPSVPKLTVTPYVTMADTQVPTCYPVVGSVTTTGATIKCFRTQTLLGLGLVPFTVAPAGVTFDVLALPGS